MISIIPRYIFNFIFYVLLQVVILNKMEFSGYLNPYLYVIFILILPFETPGWLIINAGFYFRLKYRYVFKHDRYAYGCNLAYCLFTTVYSIPIFPLEIIMNQVPFRYLRTMAFPGFLNMQPFWFSFITLSILL